MLTIKGRSLGTRKQLFEEFSVPLPPSLESGNVTLRELITAVVEHEVEAFKKRQTDRQFIRVLTQSEVDSGEQAGKIESGGSAIPVQSVDVGEAIEVALSGFTDGLYITVVDQQEQKNLDATISLTPTSEMTFIRLTMLAGG